MPDASTVSGVRGSRIEELENAFMALEAEKTRLESRSRANEHFFMGMADEIQTPLKQAALMTDLLMAERLDPKALDIARDIGEIMRTVLETVRDVLDLSKIKSGALVLEDRHYDFFALMKSVRSSAFFQAKEKNLAFDFSVDPALPRFLRGDPDRLRQILSHIIANAVKFTDRGRVSVTVVKDADAMRVNVTDTGRGIDPENLDLLFTPFHQPSAGPSVGLGMAIGKSLVEMMGGRVLVDSVPGAGSSVRLRLPLTPGDSGASGNAGPKKDAPPRRRVLIVDDNENNLRAASAALAAIGHDCETAASGPVALECLMTKEYHLVLMDYEMPGMNGADVSEAVRALGHGELPIVGMSARPERDAARLIESGMNDVLAKPVAEAELLRTLEKWLPPVQAPDSARASGKGDTSIMSGDCLRERGYCGIVESASKIEGLDVVQGLQAASGQHGMYEELLQLAAETLPGLIDNLLAAAGEKDAQRLRVELHGLGESLDAIGMIGLSRNALECEARLEKEGLASCENVVIALVRDLRLFAGRLGDLFESGSRSSSVLYGSAAALETRLHKMLHAMAVGNHVEVRKQAAAATRRKYDAAHRMPLMEIRRLVNAGEYKSAKNRIHEILRATAPK